MIPHLLGFPPSALAAGRARAEHVAPRLQVCYLAALVAAGNEAADYDSGLSRLIPPDKCPLDPAVALRRRAGRGGGFAQGFFGGKLLFGHSPINTEPSWIVENPFPLTGRALTPHSLGQYPIFKS